MLVLGAFAILASVPSARAWNRSCGSAVENYRDQGGREEIVASHISGENLNCGVARKVAHAYLSRSHYSRTTRGGERRVRNRFPRAVGRFHCSDERVGSDISNIACFDGPESVAFVWYDSSGYH
jgi:hypothetical protein